MRAVEVGNPIALDALTLYQTPSDAGHELRPGEVRAELHAGSLHYHDYMVVTGATAVAPRRIPLSGGAGIVTDAAPGGADLAADDYVVSTPASPHQRTRSDPHLADIADAFPHRVSRRHVGAIVLSW